MAGGVALGRMVTLCGGAITAYPVESVVRDPKKAPWFETPIIFNRKSRGGRKVSKALVDELKARVEELEMENKILKMKLVGVPYYVPATTEESFKWIKYADGTGNPPPTIFGAGSTSKPLNLGDK